MSVALALPTFAVTIPMMQDGGGVAIDLERRQVPWCVRNPYWGLSFLAENVCDPNDDDQWAALREANRLEELEPVRRVAAAGGAVELAFDLPMPSVSLVELVPA